MVFIYVLINFQRLHYSLRFESFFSKWLRQIHNTTVKQPLRTYKPSLPHYLEVGRYISYANILEILTMLSVKLYNELTSYNWFTISSDVKWETIQNCDRLLINTSSINNNHSHYADLYATFYSQNYAYWYSFNNLLAFGKGW